MTNAEALADELIRQGITQIWAVQGGSVAVLLDALERRPGRLTVRYQALERDAGHAADGANTAAGCLVSAVVVTTGPGLSSLASAVQTSRDDGLGLLIIAGEGRSGDCFQWNDPALVAALEPGLILPMDKAEATSDGRPPLQPLTGWNHLLRETTQAFIDWVGRITPDTLPQAWVDAIEAAVDGMGPQDLAFADAGMTLAITYRVLAERLQERLILPYSQAPMGWAVAAASGAAGATGRRCFALVGDGSLETQIQACYVARVYSLPVVVSCLNNCGYSAIKRFQLSRNLPWVGVTPSTPVSVLKAATDRWIWAPW